MSRTLRGTTSGCTTGVPHRRRAGTSYTRACARAQLLEPPRSPSLWFCSLLAAATRASGDPCNKLDLSSIGQATVKAYAEAAEALRSKFDGIEGRVFSRLRRDERDAGARATQKHL